MERKVLNASEAAKVLGVSKPTLYRLCKMEGFPVLHVGRAVRIPTDALLRWMEDHAGEQVL